MSIRERLSGNEAVALAMRQINPDVMSAFPITPSTEIPYFFSSCVANGQVDTEFIPVESEHSAMSAAIGAQAAGARSLTATSSCGLALMWEMLYVAASNRLPIALALVNRALSGPININCDHSDSMGARDSGWIQIYSENNQDTIRLVHEPNRIAYIDSSMFGIPFEGIDSYIAGKGSMKGVLAKLFTLFNQTGEAMDKASLVTCLSECLIIPNLALQDYVVWEEIDALHAKS